jgi:hypothetical protein
MARFIGFIADQMVPKPRLRAADYTFCSNPPDELCIRAQQVWPIRVAHVMSDGQTLTYGDHAEKMGIDRRAAIGLRRQLAMVATFCA